jgi:hypothetical protein
MVQNSIVTPLSYSSSETMPLHNPTEIPTSTSTNPLTSFPRSRPRLWFFTLESTNHTQYAQSHAYLVHSSRSPITMQQCLDRASSTREPEPFEAADFDFYIYTRDMLHAKLVRDDFELVYASTRYCFNEPVITVIMRSKRDIPRLGPNVCRAESYPLSLAQRIEIAKENELEVPEVPVRAQILEFGDDSALAIMDDGCLCRVEREALVELLGFNVEKGEDLVGVSILYESWEDGGTRCLTLTEEICTQLACGPWEEYFRPILGKRLRNEGKHLECYEMRDYEDALEQRYLPS